MKDEIEYLASEWGDVIAAAAILLILGVVLIAL